jgi:hypothetical protein
VEDAQAGVAPAVDAGIAPPGPVVQVEPPPFPHRSPCLSDAGVGATPAQASTSGSTAPAPLHGVVDVTFATHVQARSEVSEGRTHKTREFVARLSVPALSLDRTVFEVPVEDPHYCCADVGPGSLDFYCEFSGIDLVSARGRVSRDGDAVVVHRCTTESTGRPEDHDDMRVPLAADANVRFHTREPSCAVPYAP